MGYNDRRWGNDDRYGSGRGHEGYYRSGQGRERGPDYDRARQTGYDYEDRGFFERAGDEVRSWFGDEEAERRRRRDEREDARYGGGGDWDRGERAYGRDQGGFRGGGWNDRPGGSGQGADWRRGAYSSSSDRPTEYGERGGDAHYHSWRNRQIDALDRDYEDYRRENQTRFESEFATYRTRRQSQRQLLEQVKEHAEVLGSDGQHVGTVDYVRGDRIKLTKSDQSAGGHHHSIPSSWLEAVEDGRVTLNKTAAEAHRLWREEEDGGDRSAFFGGGGGQDRDEASDWNQGHNLNRSFRGTY